MVKKLLKTYKKFQKTDFLDYEHLDKWSDLAEKVDELTDEILDINEHNSYALAIKMFRHIEGGLAYLIQRNNTCQLPKVA